MWFFRKRWFPVLSLVLLRCIGLPVFASRPSPAVDVDKAVADAVSACTADALAVQIDSLIAGQQKKKHVEPAPRSDDGEFIRRIYLDLAGCIPSIVDIRDFRDDNRSEKRRFWIEELLQGRKPNGKRDAYARHFANVWREWLLAGLSNQQILTQTQHLETWLLQQLQNNTAYDRMVGELLSGKQLGSSRPTRSPLEAAPSDAFLQANQHKPDQLAMSTARLFLGVQMDCARCHEDRSGGSWEQTDFWAYAACFVPATNAIPKIKIEGTNRFVSACFPDGSKLQPQPGATSRQGLIQWLTTSGNRYFAKATVNRLWWYFFGIGLVDPVDAAGDHNPPSHPELLDLLARQFTLHQFDLKYLIRAITNSQTYQRSSIAAKREAVDARLFNRMAVRTLSVEQLFDSLAEATELFDPLHGPAAGVVGAPQSVRAKFLELFSIPAQSTQPETSILQALYLMNSEFIADRTSLVGNRTLTAIADTAREGTGRQVEKLFLVVLSRKPHADEIQRYVDYVDHAGQHDDKRQALTDVFWVLLNSAEFRHNH